MAGDAVRTFTDANFETEVLGAKTPVLVDFWAEWCAPCRMLSPVIDQIAAEYAGRASVGKMDTDSNRESAVRLGITSIPTVIIFKDGKVQERFVGIQPRDRLAKAIDALM